MLFLAHSSGHLLKRSYSAAVNYKLCEGAWVVNSRLQQVPLAQNENNGVNFFALTSFIYSLDLNLFRFEPRVKKYLTGHSNFLIVEVCELKIYCRKWNKPVNFQEVT